MGEFTEKAKGLGNEIAGKTKQAVGDAIDNKEMQGKGLLQEAKGDLQKLKGDALGATGDKI
jgi:uncharacterized protein YjbJ (UPF0337 family)